MNIFHKILSLSGKPWAAKAAGQPWLYCDYSPVGDLLAVYSSNNGDWSRAYEYDWLGRRTSYNEDNLATFYTYDGLNPATETHKWQENGQPKQKTITCRYIAHRLDSVIYSDSTLPTVYSYDYAGRVASVLDESGRMDYAYGNMGEVKSETRTYALPFLATDLALTTQYEYDSWGRTTSITYPDGETVSYAYNLGGQLFRMYNVQLTMYNYLDSVLYDKFGAVTSRKYGNGLKMQYAYHPQNRRLTAITTLNGNSQLSNTAYSYDPAGNITQAVSSYPWLAGQTFTETFSYDSTNQLVSAANAQTYALSVTYGDWGKIQEYGLQQTDLANNLTTSQTRTYSYGSLNEGQTTFAPNSINYTDGTNVNEQYGINGSLQRRETNIPGNQPNEELYRFGADGNLRLYSYNRLFYSLYGYDGGTTRTYKYSMDLSPNWVNGRLEAVNFNLHNAMFYPNAYINFNNNGYYTKHYYNGTERIASRLGDQNLQIHTHDPELQDRKDWQDSLIRKNIVEITGYEFLEPGEEQTLEDPKPVFELPVIGLNNLLPSADGIYYYHSNHLGSTCYVTDENATVQQGFLYAPFGEITNEHNSNFGNGVIPKYSFNAKEMDEETGMYYYEARYMAPPVFISRDPLFEKYPTFSPYAYCVNNPIKYIDPDGRDWYVPEGENTPIYDKKVTANNCPKGATYVGRTAKWVGQNSYDSHYSFYGDENGKLTCTDNATSSTASISYGSGAKKRLSSYSTAVLLDNMFACGITAVIITSTARTPEDQARIMLSNQMNNKIITYKAPGRAVQNRYDPTKSKEDNYKSMLEEIYIQGPSNVSKHCGVWNDENVFDLQVLVNNRATNSLALDKQLKLDKRITKYLSPFSKLGETCHHIQIKQ